MKNFCGTILISGRTNVGKSTLFNKLIGNKLSIVSNRKNTTTKYILGVNNNINYQSIFIDTPGFNNKHYKYNKLKIFDKNLYIDIIILIIDRNIWKKEDSKISKIANKNKIPIILLINKIDKIKNKNILLPFLKKKFKKYNFSEIIPISSKKNIYSEKVKKIIEAKLPCRKHIFKKDFITYNTKEFIVSEIFREKFMYNLRDEIPYNINIKVQFIKKIFHEKLYIKLFIIPKNVRYKKIIIGKNGNIIKKCCFKAKKDLEKIFNKKIHINIIIKSI
ncbi:GTPase Era [Buchnera aphidicola]|uniref:GTPase Era n=1 Tax=Buchnera aphidicola TaxID=9 RepID=UPI0031B88CA5